MIKRKTEILPKFYNYRFWQNCIIIDLKKNIAEKSVLFLKKKLGVWRRPQEKELDINRNTLLAAM